MQKPITSYCFSNTKNDCFQLCHGKVYLHKQIDTQIFAAKKNLENNTTQNSNKNKDQ
jgi:hypothetical protein